MGNVPLSFARSCRAEEAPEGYLLTHLCQGCQWWAEGMRRTSGWRRWDTTDRPWLTRRSHSRTDTRRWERQTSRRRDKRKRKGKREERFMELSCSYKTCEFIRSEALLKRSKRTSIEKITYLKKRNHSFIHNDKPKIKLGTHSILVEEVEDHVG